MEQPLHHVLIIGCGLLGASLGLALKKRGLARTITGIGRRGSPSVEIAQQRGAIDRAFDDPAEPARDADMIVVCTPVRQFPETFRALAPALSKNAVVTDVGSTKVDVMMWAREIIPDHFVGSHPMAGSEKSGPEAARDDLYQGAVCLVCRGSPREPAASGFQRVTNMWEAVGMRVLECADDQHDRWVASVSHLPRAVSAALMTAASIDERALDVAAGGLIDTTRIAAGDATMWTDIFMTNRTPIVDALKAFEGHLIALRTAIERGDEKAIHAFLATAKNQRDSLMTKRGK
ncbi:MAG TPA: prephenate dehydrogenase/arogenate dehydrogenase family protein [Phycisphaerae bacterium]|nr:prephenate dehydrogenase/arogenate dehydrogenase family protein [Phycisphaerae bacterium]